MTATDSCKVCATPNPTGARTKGQSSCSARARPHGLWSWRCWRTARGEILIANRTAEKAQAVAAEFGPTVNAVEWADRNAAVARNVALLVNCTDRGMIGKPALDVDLARAERRQRSSRT